MNLIRKQMQEAGAIALACLFLAWPQAMPGQTEKASAAISGNIQGGNGFYSVVFYYQGKPPESSKEILQKLLEKALPGIPVATDPSSAQPPFIGFSEENAPLKMYPVPDAGYFKFSGRGLSEADVAAVQKTSRATEVILVAPAKDVYRLGRIFTELVQEYASSTNACIWDSATRECFTAKAWKEEHLDAWPSGSEIPLLASQVTIHLYRPKEDSRYLRAITLGMEKFGLPDVVIEKLTASDNRPAGNLINLICQYLAENPVVADGKKTEVDVAKIKNEEVRKGFQTGYLEKATGKVTLALLEGKSQEGDPDNRLVELDFGNYEGGTVDEKRNLALSGLWGSRDAIKNVEHDGKILELSKKARERLPELRKKVLGGLKPGERIMLKAPFKRDDDGEEWMWVEVMEWKEEGEVHGILQNDPFYIKNLKAGAPVVIKAAEVFDYILVNPDASREGNETGKWIEQQQGEVRTK